MDDLEEVMGLSFGSLAASDEFEIDAYEGKARKILPKNRYAKVLEDDDTNINQHQY